MSKGPIFDNQKLRKIIMNSTWLFLGLQQEEHPKKTVAFQVDQEQKLKDDEVRISQSQKDQDEKIETISAEAKLKLEEKTEEASSEINVELEKRITNQVW